MSNSSKNGILWPRRVLFRLVDSSCQSRGTGQHCSSRAAPRLSASSPAISYRVKLTLMTLVSLQNRPAGIGPPRSLTLERHGRQRRRRASSPSPPNGHAARHTLGEVRPPAAMDLPAGRLSIFGRAAGRLVVSGGQRTATLESHQVVWRLPAGLCHQGRVGRWRTIAIQRVVRLWGGWRGACRPVTGPTASRATTAGPTSESLTVGRRTGSTGADLIRTAASDHNPAGPKRQNLSYSISIIWSTRCNSYLTLKIKQIYVSAIRLLAILIR